MPEIPEIASRTAEMQTHLVGKTIRSVEVIQPKCLNLPVDEFCTAMQGQTIQRVTHHGKWIITDLTRGHWLLNLGMGGEVLLVDRTAMPAKYRLVFDFTDQTCLAVNFWWFGYAHYTSQPDLATHPMLSKLGPNALDLSPADLQHLLTGQKARIKAFLLDQSKIAGIGNAYIHDILFLARLHPLRPIPTLSPADIAALAQAIQQGLQPALQKGGAFYEKNLHGQPGGFRMEDILIGYREGQPCPTCATPIQKIKTGSTASFICPTCQPISVE